MGSCRDETPLNFKIMKLYRLKEEVKKYFNVKHTDKPRDLEHWETAGFNLEALEEVESKIDVYIKRPSENEVVNTI